MNDAPLTVFFDFGCPYCFIAHHVIGQRPSVALMTSWRPYLLRPDIPEGGGTWHLAPKEHQEFANAILERCADIDLALSVPGFRPDTRAALSLSFYADAQELGQRYREAMFRAYWLDHRNISLDDVVVDVAAEAGLPRSVAQEQINNPALRTMLAHTTVSLEEQHRIAIPTFFIGDYVIYGLPTSGTLSQVLSLCEDARALAS